MPNNTIIARALPTACAARSASPSPSEREKREALPILIKSVIARQIVVRGNATFVAAFPK